MSEKVSTLEVRQRLGDMLNRVALRHDEFVIERKGKPLAALVPVEKLEQMRRIARTDALAFLDQQRGLRLSDAEATKLALAAQGWARAAGKSRRPRK
jgi:prevent-host-death family protein